MGQLVDIWALTDHDAVQLQVATGTALREALAPLGVSTTVIAFDLAIGDPFREQFLFRSCALDARQALVPPTGIADTLIWWVLQAVRDGFVMHRLGAAMVEADVFRFDSRDDLGSLPVLLCKASELNQFCNNCSICKSVVAHTQIVGHP